MDEINQLDAQIRDKLDPVKETLRGLIIGKTGNEQMVEHLKKLLNMEMLAEHVPAVASSLKLTLELIKSQLLNADKDIREWVSSTKSSPTLGPSPDDYLL